jgi:ABC-2 type transport system permease protein
METIEKYFSRDIGLMLGRSMRRILCPMNARITVTILPVAFLLLFVYLFGGAILVTEKIFLAITGLK